METDLAIPPESTAEGDHYHDAANRDQRVHKMGQVKHVASDPTSFRRLVSTVCDLDHRKIFAVGLPPSIGPLGSRINPK